MIPDADAHLGHASGRRIARNASLRAGGEVLGKLASIAFFVAIARELGEGGFGDFVFALSLTTVLVIACGFGTEDLVAREVSRDRERVHSYLANAVAVKALLSILPLLAAALIVNLGDWSADARAAVYIIGVGVAVENLGRTWHSVFTAYERLEMISISLVIQRVLTAAVGVGVLLSGGGLVAVSIVFTAGCFLGLLTATQVLRRYVVAPRWEIDRSRWVPLLRAGVPIGLAGLLFTILLRLDASLLGFLSGGEDNSEVGIYGAAFRLIEATLFIPWALSSAVLPWLSQQKHDADVVRGSELALKAITSLLTPVGLAFTLFAGPLIELLYGEQFAEAVLPLQLLGAMTVLFGINHLASTILISRYRPRDFTLIAAVVTVENVALNVILIPKYGADATAFNAALSGVLLAVLSVALVSRRFGRINLRRTFGGPTVGALAMMAVVLPMDLPFVPAAVLGVAAYLAGLLCFERLAFPADYERLRSIARRRGALAPR